MPVNLRPRTGTSAPLPDVGLLVAIFDAVPFPLALLDQEGRLLDINRAFEAMWGPSRPTFFRELFHAGDRTVLDALLARGMWDGTTEMHLRIPQSGGALRWASVSISHLPDDDTGKRIIAASFSEITSLKQEVEELSACESRWNSALVSSVTGVWDHNWATGQKYYSPTWRRIRGMSMEDPLPASTAAWLDLLHPDDRNHVLHCMELQNAGDPDYAVFEYRERHKDGHWVWIECRGDCIEWDENGKPTRIVGTDTDITARKSAEQAAARMSRRLDMALEISGIATYECDLTTGIVDWDDRMFRIYGLDRREDVRVGGLWETFLHPEDARRVVDTVDRHVENDAPFSDQYRVLLRDGSERIIRSRTMTFTDASGHRMTVGANWDVTEDVGLHHALEKAKTLAEARNEELEAARERIEHSALHDYLTDLPNRRYLDDVLDRLGIECRLSGRSMGLLHIDLDRFKEINDSLGHGAGDAILKNAGGILRETVDPGDFVARIGGDEFVVVSTFGMSERPLHILAETLIREIRKPFSYEGHPCRVGASIGIASGRGDAIDGRQLLRNSDIALYQAKRQGRNRYVVFSATRAA